MLFSLFGDLIFEISGPFLPFRIKRNLFPFKPVYPLTARHSCFQELVFPYCQEAAGHRLAAAEPAPRPGSAIPSTRHPLEKCATFCLETLPSSGYCGPMRHFERGKSNSLDTGFITSLKLSQTPPTSPSQ